MSNNERLKLLFLCTGNSCRSQMAEGWAKHLFGDKLEVSSAGSEPATVDPRAIEVMADVGIDLSTHCSKPVTEFRDVGVDRVFTLCGDAHEQCPLWLGAATVQHHGFADPPTLARDEDTAEGVLRHYRRVRDEIGNWIKTLEEGVRADG